MIYLYRNAAVSIMTLCSFCLPVTATPPSSDTPFPPKPDFKTRFDYVAWFREHLLIPENQNAYFGYVPLQDAMERSKDGLFHDMFNDAENKAAFTPWDPLQQKKWEKSFQATHSLIELFSKATRDTRSYMALVTFPDGLPEEERCLSEWLLPGPGHYRTLTKAVLAQSWRAEHGVVDPQKMLSAWKTCLANVHHLSGSSTLIERLVAIANQDLVEKNARWALSRGVFNTPQQIEAACLALRQADVPAPNMTRSLRMESASEFDTIQLLFLPTAPGQAPRINVDRAVKMFHVDQNGETEFRQKMSRLTIADARAAVDAMDTYCRQLDQMFRTGYPKTRRADVERLEASLTQSNPLLQIMPPSLSGCYVRVNRAECSRRATQLVFALHREKARHGQWPASLDMLPPSEKPITIDPFTGSPFSYRVSADGPHLYTFSENGKDDGGVHASDWGNKKQGSDDYVFWPPQK